MWDTHSLSAAVLRLGDHFVTFFTLVAFIIPEDKSWVLPGVSGERHWPCYSGGLRQALPTLYHLLYKEAFFCSWELLCDLFLQPGLLGRGWHHSVICLA